MSAEASEKAGYRFVVRDREALWVHHLEMRPGDIDATDMSDEELLRLVEGGDA